MEKLSNKLLMPFADNYRESLRRIREEESMISELVIFILMTHQRLLTSLVRESS